MLGVDLACRSWADLGFAQLSFGPGPPATWTAAAPGCVERPEGLVTAEAVARLVDRYALENEIAAVGLDGPQGWRQPDCGPRAGVGRSCEYEARTQGKTGEFGRAYPSTQHRWMAFCIEVFDRLLDGGHAILANDPDAVTLAPPGRDRYWVLEVFPTSIWRSLGMKPLPGHRKAPRSVVAEHARALQERLALPSTAVTDHHDDLQALVSAVAAAAVVGGPCRAVPRGLAAFVVPATDAHPAHRVEGLIWETRREV